MKISVYKDRYPTSFVVPRTSAHTIDRRLFIPFDKINSNLDGIALLAPLHNADIVHAFNRLPVGERKYVISFESHLPRRFGFQRDNAFTDWMSREIASHRCRRIIALSHYARRQFLDQAKDQDALADLEAKLFVRHPNLLMGPPTDPLAEGLQAGRLDDLTITFVGAHFARKGGCVAALLAKKAHEQKLPLRIQVISSLKYGASVWTDPTSPTFIKPYLAMLKLPNVTVRDGLPNRAVRKALGQSHFGFLPTFSDTFGYSVIEAMAEHTPSIATAVQAIPEVVMDGVNGILLPLPTDAIGNWLQPPTETRGEPEYARAFGEEAERLADAALAAILPFLGAPDRLLQMRRYARLTAERMFAPDVSTAFYDPFYERVAAEDVRTKPVRHALDVSSPTVKDIDLV
jgi:glycosyltransferase involved in cell wall biosynthesis